MFKKINECRCCGSNKLKQYLNFGKQPLANSYHTGCTLDEFELIVNVCEECFHSQLSIVVDPEIMFKHYLYVSGTTKTFKTHCDEFAKYCLDLYGRSDVIVNDIACNDGTLLQSFRALGSVVHGVEPAENLRQFTMEKNIDVVVDFWNTGISERIGKTFDIITGTNVFAHVDDVFAFLSECKKSLNENGIVVLEFPYAKDFVKHLEFDTVYHEHLSYFTANSLSVLAKRVGFNICDIVTTKIHGGSIRFALSLTRQETPKLKNILSEERNNGTLDIVSYEKYQHNVDKTKKDICDYVNGKKVIGYAASAKGNTALNYFGLSELDYIVDDNELKHNYFTPGTNIKIIDTESGLNVDSELNIIILAWNFKDEIKNKIKTIRRGKKTSMIYYVPNFYIEEIE